MKTLKKISYLLLLIFSSLLNAKTMKICNAAPFQTEIAVAYFTLENNLSSKGWYHLEPGDCASWNDVKGTKFHYWANATSNLAKWLSDSDSVEWWGFKRLCVTNEAFSIPHFKGIKCSKTKGFKSITINKGASTLTLYDENHKGIPLHEAQELNRVLLGRMNFESILRENPGKESAFSLGIGIENGQQGVLINKIHSGMPAELHGLQKLDQIIELDGYRVNTTKDLVWVLNQIEILRNDALQIKFIRGYEEWEGSIAPMFFEFNHPEYKPSGKTGAFIWSLADGASFGFFNELACFAGNTIKESLLSASDSHDFNIKSVSNNTSKCSGSLNANLSKKEILYKKAAIAGGYASFLVPGLPLLKSTRLMKALPLAARSRYVSRNIPQTLRRK